MSIREAAGDPTGSGGDNGNLPHPDQCSRLREKNSIPAPSLAQKEEHP
jgi:hypothetical protein